MTTITKLLFVFTACFFFAGLKQLIIGFCYSANPKERQIWRDSKKLFNFVTIASSLSLVAASISLLLES